MHSFSNFTLGLLLLTLCIFTPGVKLWQRSQKAVQEPKQQALQGVWELKSGKTFFTDLPKGATALTVMQDGYFTVAYFDQAAKKFIGTFGGSYTVANGKLTQQFEFNTLDSTTVGTTKVLSYFLRNGQLQISSPDNRKGAAQNWVKQKTKTGSSPLEGTWRITGRARGDGEMSQMQRGPRKTLKVLPGNRFQWIAFNTETKQFSGTGGGTYSAENGKYTENIEFFSRDPERVGARLTFNYEVKDGKWHHTGQSSTGNTINEVWEREH